MHKFRENFICKTGVVLKKLREEAQFCSLPHQVKLKYFQNLKCQLLFGKSTTCLGHNSTTFDF